MSINIHRMLRALRAVPTALQRAGVCLRPQADQTSIWATTTACIWMEIGQRQPVMPISMASKMVPAPNTLPRMMRQRRRSPNCKWPLSIAIVAIHFAWCCPKFDKNYLLPVCKLGSVVYLCSSFIYYAEMDWWMMFVDLLQIFNVEI